MVILSAFLIVHFFVGNNAAPWSSDLPNSCTSECSSTQPPILAYELETTYSYIYSGHSEIQWIDNGGEGEAFSQMEWTYLVDITWLNPCTVVISFKNQSVTEAESFTTSPGPNALTDYPLIASMRNGKVSHVCSHPKDEPGSINLKKGVISALQNSLPTNVSFDESYSHFDVIENDMTGECPTKYEVRNKGENITVKKMKEHTSCKNRFPSHDNNMHNLMSLLFSKSARYLYVSLSKCTQKITNGIYTSIMCEDENDFQRFHGLNYIKAKHVSNLRFLFDIEVAPENVFDIENQNRISSLTYTYDPPKKDSSQVIQFEQILREVCEKTNKNVEKETASLMNKAIKYMQTIPSESIDETLIRIRGGQICTDYHKLESLFLDAVAFIPDHSAIKIMVDEIINKKVTGSRGFLYTFSLFFNKNPTLLVVAALKPIFEKSDEFPLTSLAAAGIVNNYCKLNVNCQNESQIIEATEILDRNIYNNCISLDKKIEGIACLAFIKSLGNMGVMTTNTSTNIINFIKMNEVQKHLQIAAIQAFRNAPCETETTAEFINIGINREKQMNIRIAAYIQAIKCGEYDDLVTIAESLRMEVNQQALQIVFYYLERQEAFSLKSKKNIIQGIIYSRNNTVTPNNFTSNAKEYSKKIDFLDFAIHPAVRSDVIYAPDSFIPSSFNFDMRAYGNKGKLGARLGEFENMFEDLFGPIHSFQDTSLSSLYETILTILDLVKRNGPNILENLTKHMKLSHLIDISIFENFFKQIHWPRLDLFAHLNEQEVFYAFLNQAMLQNINISHFTHDKSLYEFFNNFFDSISPTIINTVRTLGLFLDFTIPTIQGIPLEIRIGGTSILEMNIQNNLRNLLKGSPSKMMINPSLSAEIEGFFGYKLFNSSVGVRTVNKIYSNMGISLNVTISRRFELELDVPKTMDILYLKSDTYLMKSLKGQPEIKIDLQGTGSDRIVQDLRCLAQLEDVIGLNVCSEFDVPAEFSVLNLLQIDRPTLFKLTGEKSETLMRGFRINLNISTSPTRKEFTFLMDTPGSYQSRNADGHLLYIVEPGLYKAEVTLKAFSLGGIKMQVQTNSSHYKQELEVNAFFSHIGDFNPETQVVEFKISAEFSDQESQELVFPHTDFNINSDIDIYLENYKVLQGSKTWHIGEVRLDTVDLKALIWNYKLVASLHKQTDIRFTSFVQFGSRFVDVFTMKALHNLQHDWNEGTYFTTVASGNLENTKYKGVLDVFRTSNKTGTYLQIIDTRRNLTLVDWDAGIRFSRRSFIGQIKLDLYGCRDCLNFECMLKNLNRPQIHLHQSLKQRNEPIIQIDGTYTTPSSNNHPIEANILIQTHELDFNNISSNIIWSNSKKALSVEMKEFNETLIELQVRSTDDIISMKIDVLEDPLYTLEWISYIRKRGQHRNRQQIIEEEAKLFPLVLQAEEYDSVEIQEERNEVLKWKIPEIFDGKMVITITPIDIQGSLSHFGYSQSVIGFTSIDLKNKTGNIKLTWDFFNGPGSFSINGSVINHSSSYQQTTLRGVCNIDDRIYPYEADIQQSNPESWLYGRKNIKVDAKPNDKEIYTLATTSVIEGYPSHTEVDAHLMFRNHKNEEFLINQTLVIEYPEGVYNFGFSSETNVINDGEKTHVEMEAKHELNAEDHDIKIQLQFNESSSNYTRLHSFVMENHPSSWFARYQEESEDQSEYALYELSLSPDGRVETAKIGFNVEEVVDAINYIEEVSGLHERNGYEYREKEYLISYESATVETYKIFLHSPDLSMGGNLIYSPSQYSFIFHPKGNLSRFKYELSFAISNTSNIAKEQIKYSLRLDHPALRRENYFEFQYTLGERIIEGALLLDVFANSGRNITSTLKYAKSNENALSLEANFTSIMFYSPRIRIATCQSPSTISFDFDMDNVYSSQHFPTILISGIYNISSINNKTYTLNWKTGEGDILEVSGSTIPLSNRECNGLEVSAKAQSSVLETQEFTARFCTPGSIIMSTKRKNSDTSYIGKADLQKLKEMKFNLLKKHKTKKEQKLLLAQSFITSPSSIYANVIYEPELHNLKQSISTSIRSLNNKLYSANSSQIFPTYC